MRGRVGLIGSVLVLGCLAGARPAGATYLYFTPTLGGWHWDEGAYPDLDFDHSWGAVYGGRAGYAFTQAFSAELIGLTGTNNAVPAVELFPSQPSESLRLTQLEISLLVHFQSLTSTKIYPFLDLGVGVAVRRGGPGSLDDQHTAFHLGGGIMFVLDERFALRTNLRDTFFSYKRQEGNLTEQLTVDSLELSLGVEFRIPTKQKGSRPE